MQDRRNLLHVDWSAGPGKALLDRALASPGSAGPSGYAVADGGNRPEGFLENHVVSWGL